MSFSIAPDQGVGGTESFITGEVCNVQYIEINGTTYVNGSIWTKSGPGDFGICFLTIIWPANNPGTVPVLLKDSNFNLIASLSFTYLPIPCLAPQTKILMADGTQKEIRSIQRGDLVFGDMERTTVFRVSRVNKTPYTENDVTQVCVFAPGSVIGNTDTLRVTGYHPIMFAGARRPARCFRNANGVTCSETTIKDVMDPENTGDRAVYDLQFDFDGQYVAEGALLQSRCPCYAHDALPKAMYFDQSLYRDERTLDVLDHKLPLDTTVLVPDVQGVTDMVVDVQDEVAAVRATM